MRPASVIRRRDNLFGDFPPKPQRVHRSTYQRKRERARDNSLATLAALLDRTRPAWRSSVVGTARGEI